jgi:hypothetical protein
VPKENEGEAIWVLEIATNELDTLGNKIRPRFVNLKTSNNVDEEVQDKIAEISALIDWSPFIDDNSAPIVEDVNVTDDFSIEGALEFKIKEFLPAAGIDLNSIEVTVNGVDVTSELNISGDPYEYKVKWKPSVVYYD